MNERNKLLSVYRNSLPIEEFEQFCELAEKNEDLAYIVALSDNNLAMVIEFLERCRVQTQ